jgi:amidophosphoribosyltransferase
MCGVFGIHDAPGAPDRDVARLTFFGLYALQHRGQESAGIAVSDGGRVMAMKEMGLVNQAFDEPKLAALPGHIAIGHTRYSTTGSTVWRNAQPIVRHGTARTVALGHNGNLTNTTELREQLTGRGLRLQSSSDTEVIAALIAENPAGSLAGAVAETMGSIEGAFAAVVLGERELVGFRDPDGIRPLVVGRLDDAWVLASESCALDIIGARIERELAPGELVAIDEHGARFVQAVPRRSGSLCIFELIYFARPDSTLQGQGLYDARGRMGERLALEAPVDADVVIPVPDSGTPAAVGYARQSGIPFGEGLVKNRYVGRTFIQPDQALRERGVKLKFNALRSVLEGRRVVVVDDSIVRGSTTRKLVAMLFESGAREVHLRISSPPIVSPCFYGIDMADQNELIAAGRSVEDVRERLGATSLAYLSLEGLQQATGQPAERFCRACLTGDYPTAVPADLRAAKLRFEELPVRRTAPPPVPTR